MRQKNLGLLARTPKDVLEEAAEMMADGLTLSNVARYLGLRADVLRYHFIPHRKKEIIKHNLQWRQMNPEKAKKQNKGYRERLKKINK